MPRIIIPDMALPGPKSWDWWLGLAQIVAIALGTVYLLIIRPFLQPDAAQAAADREPLVPPPSPRRTAAARDGTVPLGSPTSAPGMTASTVSPAVLPSPPVPSPAALLGDGGCWGKVTPLTGGDPPRDVEAPRSEPARPARARVTYLDNLKVFLTALVVVHHIFCDFGTGGFYLNTVYCPELPQDASLLTPQVMAACVDNYFAWGLAPAFTTLNDGYFMTLFFFISGYFTPSSLDRKGTALFLKDRFQRLGIPALAYFFVLGPLLIFLNLRGPMQDGDTTYGEYHTWVHAGPPWFIAWLLTFNVIYACTDGEPVRLPAPRAGALVVIGLAVGYVKNAAPDASFMNMPSGLKHMAMYVPFFAGGILARRNGWLDAIPSLPRRTVWLLRAGTLWFVAAVFLGVALSHKYAVPNAAAAPQFQVLLGLWLVCITAAELQFFCQYLNTTGRVVRCMSEAAYGVYIIHPWVVVLVQWTWIAAMEHSGFRSLRAFTTSGVGGLSVLFESSNRGWTWAGFVYTTVLSNLVVWPLAYAIRQLPGFKQVL